MKVDRLKMRYRLAFAGSVLGGILSQACGTALALPTASPIGAEETKASGCTVSLSTEVAGFPYATVAEASVTGRCSAADTSWSLLTDPNGVVYRVYADMDKLLADQPSANGRGAFLKVVDFIHTNPVCVEATVQSSTARIALLGTSCPRG